MTTARKSTAGFAVASLASLGGALILSACAAQSSSLYTPPSPRQIESTALVQASRDETRRRIVAGFTPEGLQLDEIGTGDRMLFYRAETNQAAPYVDCGHARQDYVSARGERESVEYPAAGRVQYKTAGPDGAPHRITQRTWMTAEARIALTPVDQQTRVSVTTDYRLTFTEIRQPLDRDGRPKGDATKTTRAVRFSSDQPAGAQGDRPACRSTGLLEGMILAAARGQG